MRKERWKISNQKVSLSLSVNPKHSISELFKASTRCFRHFWEKFKGKWNTPFSVILEHTLNVNHLSNVILGFIPRIHAEHSSLLDTRVILGVLSVGGIQGFSKAMREYRSNQQKQQLS